MGYDAGKRIKGRKRFFLVDTAGRLLVAWVTSAACHDGACAAACWDALTIRCPLLDRLQTLYVDTTFASVLRRHVEQRPVEERALAVVVPSEIAVHKGPFCIHTKRWVVERSIAWANTNRRLAKDYERKTTTATAWLYLANIRQLL